MNTSGASCAIYHESFIPVADGIHIIMTVERSVKSVWSLNVIRGLLVFLQITGLFCLSPGLTPSLWPQIFRLGAQLEERGPKM